MPALTFFPAFSLTNSQMIETHIFLFISGFAAAALRAVFHSKSSAFVYFIRANLFGTHKTHTHTHTHVRTFKIYTFLALFSNHWHTHIQHALQHAYCGMQRFSWLAACESVFFFFGRERGFSCQAWPGGARANGAQLKNALNANECGN